MRITFVLPGYASSPVGGFKVVYEYSNRLAQRGHQVTVAHALRLSSPAPPNLYRVLRRKGREIRDSFIKPEIGWFPVDKRVRLVVVPELARARIPDGDVIFATAWQTAEFILHYPSSKGRRLYMVMDFDPWLGPRDRLEATWRWPFSKVTISKWLYNRVTATAGATTDIVNIPVGVDHHTFRLKGPISFRPKRAAMLYGLSSYKVPQDGLRALEIVKARHPDLEVSIFGPASQRPEDVPLWAAYRGNVAETELVEIYNGARIYVCCSIAEGFAFPPAEAMACGCAVVSTDCGGIREYAEHEVNALLSPPQEPQALAANIIRLLENEDLRRCLARAGNERIQEFTWERSTQQLEEFINKRVREITSQDGHP
jgi:L-malate glycosyltransferase